MNQEQGTVKQTIPVKPSKQRLQLISLGVVAAGLFLMIINWHSALSDGTYFPKASFVAPMVLGWGVALLLAKNKELNNSTVEAAPMNQPGFIGLGILLGIVNWLLISGTLTLPF